MVRRIVTGVTENGKPSIVSDGEPPRTNRLIQTPGFMNSLVWATAAPATPDADPTGEVTSYVPGPGETIAIIITLPPDDVYSAPSYDPVQAAAEQIEAAPGLAETFEAASPGMHTTHTVDYCVVLEGEVVLDLDGQSTSLGPGDIVVQNATRHAWRIPGDSPATLFCVLVGAGGPVTENEQRGSGPSD